MGEEAVLIGWNIHTHGILLYKWGIGVDNKTTWLNNIGTKVWYHI